MFFLVFFAAIMRSWVNNTGLLCVCHIRWTFASCKQTLLRRQWISKCVAPIPCAMHKYTAGSLSLVSKVNHQHYPPLQVFYLTEYITIS